MKLRLGRGFALALLAAIAAAVLGLSLCQPKRSPPAPATKPAPAKNTAANCGGSAFMQEAARANAVTLQHAQWSPFGGGERGWEIYAPQVAREIRSGCEATTTGFARDLAAWQARRGLPADGRMTQTTFAAVKAAWHQRRPLRGKLSPAACPPPPPPSQLQDATPIEGYRGKIVKLRPAVLEAWREMREAANAEEPAIAADPLALTLISGYRDPASDAARCAIEQNCDGRRRALCSAHRTGLVFDLYVGASPGSDPTSTDPENRLYQSRTPAYRWMVRNAHRFGFVNYVYEPWHWEWSGPSEFGTPAPLAP